MTVCADFVVIGAGAYGTALAITLARVGNKVLLWGRNSAHIDHLKVVRCNQNVLPDVFFPPSLFLESVLPLALSFSRNIIIAVPSYSFNDVLMRLKPYLRCDARIILATKGLEANTGRLLQDVVVDILGSEIPLAVISGPTFAYEMAIGMPTAISISATDPIFVTDLRDLLHCGAHFRVYINSDIIGLQIAGAVKNVIAIGIGISDGIGFGANARTALITRGLAEMSRLGVAMGATLGVFMGLAGVGDLVLTCTDNRSRNRRFGILLGQGVSICDAYRSIGQVVEGFYNTKEVYNLSHKYMVDMPITEQIYYILYKDENVYTAVSALLNRKQKYESYDFLF